MRYIKNNRAKERKEKKYHKIRESKKRQFPISQRGSRSQARSQDPHYYPTFFRYFWQRGPRRQHISETFIRTLRQIVCCIQDPCIENSSCQISLTETKRRIDWRNEFVHGLVKTIYLSDMTARYQGPVRGIDMRRALRKMRFQVSLMDAYNISKHCTDWQGKILEIFH